jgi:hypothetical protein
LYIFTFYLYNNSTAGASLAVFGSKKGNIMNIVLVLHETKRRKETGVILKLDFEKSYDKVHWGFLIKCLRARGFSSTWCSWIEQILHNGTVAVKINNCVGPYFQNHKGVRQGDPLSPLLFNIVADCLTRMVGYQSST